eukprot:6196349-Pleurochrysis_carterae.AAC.2
MRVCSACLCGQILERFAHACILAVAQRLLHAPALRAPSTDLLRRTRVMHACSTWHRVVTPRTLCMHTRSDKTGQRSHRVDEERIAEPLAEIFWTEELSLASADWRAVRILWRQRRVRLGIHADDAQQLGARVPRGGDCLVVAHGAVRRARLAKPVRPSALD